MSPIASARRAACTAQCSKGSVGEAAKPRVIVASGRAASTSASVEAGTVDTTAALSAGAATRVVSGTVSRGAGTSCANIGAAAASAHAAAIAATRRPFVPIIPRLS